MNPLTGRVCALLWSLLISTLAQAGESLPGQLDWVRSMALSLPQSGVIEKVLVAPGERVRQGQELLRLDRAVEQVSLQAARSRHQEAQLRLAEARREGERAKELYERALVSDHELQLTQIAEQAAQAQQLEAQTRLVMAQRQLEYGILRAPWEGRVSAVFVQAAQAVVNRYAPIPLLELVQDKTMRVHARVPFERLAQLPSGQAVDVVVNDKHYAGTVQSLEWSTELKPEPGYRLTVTITSVTDVALHAGMPAAILLP